MSKQTKTNKLNYLVDPTFSRAIRLFVVTLINDRMIEFLFESTIDQVLK